MKSFQKLVEAVFVCVVVLAVGSSASYAVQAAPDVPEAPPDITVVRNIPTSLWSTPSPDPTGVDYYASSGYLFISDSEVDEWVGYQNANIYIADLNGNLVSTCNHISGSEPAGLAVNPDTGNVFITDDFEDLVFEVHIGPDGQFCTGDDLVSSFSVDTLAGMETDPEGITFGGGQMVIAAGDTNAAIFVQPGSDGQFGGNDDVVNTIQMSAGNYALNKVEGASYHPGRDTFFFVSNNNKIVETKPNGDFIKAWSFFGLGIEMPGGIAIAPSSQDPALWNAYVSDRGIDVSLDAINGNDGKIVEFSLVLSPIPPDVVPPAFSLMLPVVLR